MVKVAPHIRSIVNHDGAVILDMPANRISTLNATGAYIWARLQEGKAIGSIVAELARDTGQTSAIVEHDVQEFLQQLTERHLLNV
jgi:Coenzyme PQQ synthesis protein D (PqqD)